MTLYSIAPLLKYKGYSDKRVAQTPRYMDKRDERNCERTKNQRKKDNTRIIQDRPLG
tara:strand:- start:186 stop:356 length:171 start_codon:yes stop_codon:yes gene_type:complete